MKIALNVRSMNGRRACRLVARLLVLALTAAAPAGETPAAPAAPAPQPPRAARSVHLHYPAPEANAFYNELTVTRSTPGSYFMACGFNHGYFGIQEQAKGRKVVIFSVWDPTKGDKAAAVPEEQRVETLYKADDVEAKRFGGEGTGGQSFFRFDWKEGQTYRFFVRATVDGEKTAYAGYFWRPEAKTWKHLVTFRTRTGGERLKGLYSFVEDFRRDGASAGDVRRAALGNGWVLSADEKNDKWQPLLRARFTASSATWEAKDTIDAGVADGRFYLQTGGDTHTSTPLNSTIDRHAEGTKPPDVPGKD